MKKKWLIGGALVLVLAVAGLSGCNDWSAPDISGGSSSGINVNVGGQEEGIWVSGTGEVSVVPDLVTLGLGVEAQESTVVEARAQAAEAMDSIMAVLQENGVADEDIQTRYYSIQDISRWNEFKEEQVITGYRVTNTVTVKMRDMEKVGEVIDAVALAGGDLTRINNIAFSVEEPEDYYEEVREKAVADARSKAEQLADFAGVKLGKTTYISEGPVSSPVIYRSAYDMAEGAIAIPAPVVDTSISAGEMEISLSVRIGYAIAD